MELHLLGEHIKPRQHIKKQRHYFANKGPSSQSYGFSSSHVWMWELDHKESLALKNSCFWTVVLEKTLESPLDSKEIKPVNPKRNQPWIFNGRTDAEAEAPVLWPPDGKSWLTGKDPDSGKDWRQEEKGMTEDEMVGWHHWLNGYEFEKPQGVGEGQGSLACCSPRDCKESDMTERLNWSEILHALLTRTFGGQESDIHMDTLEKGVTEDEMAGWHHWLNGHEFEKTLGDSEGQGSLECCSSWGCKELDTI